MTSTNIKSYSQKAGARRMTRRKNTKTRRTTRRKTTRKTRSKKMTNRKTSRNKKTRKMKGGAPFQTNDAFLGPLNYQQECPQDKEKESQRAVFKRQLENVNHPCNVKLSNVANNDVRNPKTGKPYSIDDLPEELITAAEREKMKACVDAVKKVNDEPCGTFKSKTTCLGGNAGQRPDGTFGRYRGEPVRIRNAHLIGDTAIQLQDYDNEGNTKVYNYCKQYTQATKPLAVADMSDPLKVRTGSVHDKGAAFNQDAAKNIQIREGLRKYETNVFKPQAGAGKRKSKKRSNKKRTIRK